MNSKAIGLAKIVVSPLVLYVLLRYSVRWLLGIQLGFAFGTDYNFVPQLLIAFAAFMIALYDEKTPDFSFRPRNGILTAALAIGFLIFTSALSPYVSYRYPFFIVLWFVLAALTVLSTLFLWISPLYFIRSSKLYLAVPALLAGLSGWMVLWHQHPLARAVTWFTGATLYQITSLADDSVQFQVRTAFDRFGNVDDAYLLLHPSFAFNIGTGCSGLEGVSLFVFLFGLIFLSYSKLLSKRTWFFSFVAGVLYMYLLNILRLAILFLTGIWGGASGEAFSLGLLHDYLGWILYGCGLYFFFNHLLAVEGLHWSHSKKARVAP